MPRIYLPYASQSGRPPRRLAIDPVTRIEGHLRLEVQIEGGRVTDAWSSGTMFRGIELVLAGRDPREVWLYAQRICGVCTTAHALASVRAVEDALQIQVPKNAHLIRNLLTGAQYVQDHVIHFYHLHGPDWIDVVAAVTADPATTSDLARSISDWPHSEPDYFAAVRRRLQELVDSGQLGIFGNGYWGHPAYRLPAEANLLLLAHYLEALGWQREIIKMHAVLGGKNPHPQTYLVGGMATPLDPQRPETLNLETLARLRQWAGQAAAFVRQVYLPDLLLLASHYPEWMQLGRGPGQYLAVGEFTTADEPPTSWLPGGTVSAGELDAPPAVLDQRLIREDVSRAWYESDNGGAGMHPRQAQTRPHYSGPQPPYDFLDTDGAYSWLKAPRYDGRPHEVGPLARMAVAYAAGHTAVREAVDDALARLGVGRQALFSTLGRVLARGLETQVVAQELVRWVDELEANIKGGDLTVHNGLRWDPASWPAAEGWATVEAPRGALTHWLRLAEGQIEHYQIIAPSTWNGSPRDGEGQRGPWEEALLDTPVVDPERPLEILRTVHSFDPCMACAVHLLDAGGHATRVIRVD